MKSMLLFSLGTLSLTAAATALAGDVCCGVLSVDNARGQVTAFEHASGNIFSFSVKNKALLSSIRPCQSFGAQLGGARQGLGFAADFGDEVKPVEPVNGIVVSAPGTAGRVLGVQPHAKHEGLTMILTDLKRDGDLVTASCLYCNGGSEEVHLASEMRARASGAKLLDTANRVQSEVVRVQGGGRLMSEHKSRDQKLGPNQALRTWVKFAAPEGERVTLILPGAAEPFENLPIAK